MIGILLYSLRYFGSESHKEKRGGGIPLGHQCTRLGVGLHHHQAFFTTLTVPPPQDDVHKQCAYLQAPTTARKNAGDGIFRDNIQQVVADTTWSACCQTTIMRKIRPVYSSILPLIRRTYIQQYLVLFRQNEIITRLLVVLRDPEYVVSRY